MGLGGILVLVALLVSLIAFIYIVVLSARGWGVLHTLLLCTLFIECWVFMFFSAGVHYERVRATKLAFENVKRATEAEALTQQLKWGEFTLVSESQDAAIPLKNELRRLTADRGRVWRQVELLQRNPGEYLLELPSMQPAAVDGLIEPDANAAAATPNSESLPQGLVVYGFAEQMTDEGQPLPQFYLGEFRVKASQNGTVTLEPTRPLLPDQEARIQQDMATSWTLYELLPLDSHKAFAAPGSSPNNEAIFGNMEEATMQELFANIPEEDGRRQRIIDSYLLDGKRAPDGAPQETLWVQLNLLKPYETSVDSEESANATERGYFDSTGRSIDTRLKRAAEGNDEASGQVSLSPDETRGNLIIVKEEAARSMVEQGIAEVEQRIYVRPLIDYEEALNHFYRHMHELRERIVLVKRESAEIAEADRLGREMIVESQAEYQRLASDVQNIEEELALLDQLNTSEDERLAALRSELSQMYKAIHARQTQLDAVR